MPQLESFKEKKKRMGVVEEDDMRVIERLAKLNPGIIKCPTCGGPLEVHHWEKDGRLRIPYFKCVRCGFLG
jgi:ferredoxin-like protein FixX